MTIKDAAVIRITNLCKERGIKVNQLANNAGMTPSTLYSFLSGERKDVQLSTIKKICDGLGISFIDFANDEAFENLEQEIY